MASARLQITVEGATNLYNADGFLAGKSDPYVIVEVPGQEGMKFQTPVISNNLNPVWNYTGEIAGFMDGDMLQFTVMDKDTWPKPDQLLGKALLGASDFYPNGFHSEIQLEESKTNATLAIMVSIVGCDELGMEQNAAGMMTVEEGAQQMVGYEGQLQPGIAQPGMAVGGGGMMMASGEQTLLVSIINAQGLYNADGFLAGKSDPYCICLVPEKPDLKFQTAVISNCLDPEWNHTGRIEGFQAGDSLEFQVWDSDTFPKPDQLLGKVLLQSQDFFANPEGLQGVVQLTGGLSGDENGTLEICIQPETGGLTAEMPQMEMQAVGGGSAGMMVPGTTQVAAGTVAMSGPTTTYSAVTVPGQPCYSGSPVTYSSFPTTQTMTPTTQTMTYGAPQAVSTSWLSQPQGASMSLTSQPSMSPMTYSTVGQVPQMGSMSIPQPSITYSAAPGAAVATGGSQTGKTVQVIVHAPVTVSAQEFAQSNGTIVSTPLPVTVGAHSGPVEMLEQISEGIVGTTSGKLSKKKKSKSCC